MIENMDSRKIEQMELTPKNFRHIAQHSVGRYSEEKLMTMMKSATAKNETWLIRVFGEF